jgi:predicted nucleic acid-binding protein
VGVGVGVLLALALSVVYASKLLPSAVSVELEETVVRSLVKDPQVRVLLAVESQLPATFRGINGELEIAGLPAEYRIGGLTRGDQIARKERREIAVYVTLGSRQLARAATRVLFGESVPVTFDGTIFVDVLGLSVEVPLELREEIVFE